MAKLFLLILYFYPSVNFDPVEISVQFQQSRHQIHSFTILWKKPQNDTAYSGVSFFVNFRPICLCLGGYKKDT